MLVVEVRLITGPREVLELTLAEECEVKLGTSVLEDFSLREKSPIAVDVIGRNIKVRYSIGRTSCLGFVC